jgi:Spirocyclase AveC-like
VSTLDSAPPAVAAPRTTTPVKFWALVGCLLWTFQIYVLLRWLTGPFFTPVESGPDSPPTLMKVGIIIVLVVQAVAFVGLAYLWIIRPLRRDRRIGFDGMIFIAFIGFYWLWDPIGNYFALTSSYNAWIPNMGSWVNDIPGWRSPGSPGHQIPEPWLVVGPGYAVYGTVMVVVSCWLMRQIRSRWPRTGTWGLLIIVFVVMFVLETAMEMSGTRVGVWAYGGTNGLPTLFPDHYYRYPLTESLWGAAITAIAYMRWSRNDKGESIAERGLSEVRAPEIGKQAMRLMAITGCAYSLIFIVYWVPVFVLWRSQPEGWPLDLQMRSYLGSNYRCGPETKVACPNPNVPYTRPGSISITPDGKLYVPPGTKLPDDPTTFDEAKRRAGQR